MGQPLSPDRPEGEVLGRGLAGLLAGLRDDAGDLLEAVLQVTTLAPAELRRHQELPRLVDAVLALLDTRKKRNESILCVCMDTGLKMD